MPDYVAETRALGRAQTLQQYLISNKMVNRALQDNCLGSSSIASQSHIIVDCSTDRNVIS